MQRCRKNASGKKVGGTIKYLVNTKGPSLDVLHDVYCYVLMYSSETCRSVGYEVQIQDVNR